MGDIIKGRARFRTGGCKELDPLHDINFIRPGSLGLTYRAVGEEPRWAENSETKEICVTLGLSKVPLKLTVREFIPGPNDITARNWIAPDGLTHHWTQLAPYAIANVDEAAAAVEAYIKDNCLCFVEIAASSHDLVQAVYARMEPQLDALRQRTGTPEADDVDRELYELMSLYCPMWWGMRNMMGSAWLIGPETLDMEPCWDKGYPLLGKISVPRQVVQTAGCLINQVVQPMQARFLEALDRVVAADRGEPFDRRAFYTVFLLVFAMLHEVEDIGKDRERYARQNFLKTRYSLPEYVESLHESARLLVEHWIRFAQRLKVDFGDKDAFETSLAWLPKAERDVCVASYVMIDPKGHALYKASPLTWHLDLCFVGHMFEQDFEDDALYRGE